MDCKIINKQQVTTLSELFNERLKLSPDKIAYQQYDVASQSWTSATWQEMSNEIKRWQAAFAKESLQPGDRVAVMLKNSREWVVFDQAALGMGLVTVPLYVEDRPENIAYIINHADVQLLFLQDKQQWQRIIKDDVDLGGLKRIISIIRISEDDEPNDSRLESLSDWLFGGQGELQHRDTDPDALASIVYTSGTTGRSKGVMLSHKNILSNVFAASECNEWTYDDVFLSFLPLSHMLERTAGYYLPILLGATVAYSRSIPQLGEDLLSIKPTILISVPRIFEKVYAKIQDGLKQKSPIARALFSLAINVGWDKFQYEQGRGSWNPKLLLWPLLNKLVAGKILEKLGGRMQLAICGGAALSEDVAKLFIGLGLPLVQGYGLTESSPVISVNRVADNIPSSIGTALPGVQVRIGDNDELQSNSDSSMMGYWKNETATTESFTEDGWLKTGDKARIDADNHIYITGRLKDIIVLSNGEKVPPSDMELAIALDPLFEQVIILGEGRSFLTTLVVLEPQAWSELAVSISIHPESPGALRKEIVEQAILEKIMARLDQFPGYAKIYKVKAMLEPWTVDEGLITPTMKIKRAKIMEKFSDEIDSMYQGH